MVNAASEGAESVFFGCFSDSIENALLRQLTGIKTPGFHIMAHMRTQ
jgi:hypothetical protein